MKADNPLTREFLLQYSAAAARSLEQVSVKHIVALFAELPAPQVVTVIAAMLPEIAAACLSMMAPKSAAGLIIDLPLSSATRLFKLLSPAKQNELSAQLPDSILRQLRRNLVYPTQTAGAMLDSKIDILPQNITVSDAIRRIERLEHAISCDIYIIDDAHHLVGSIELGKLLVSSHHPMLRDIMNRKTQPVSVHATVQSLLTHPGWSRRRSLPVVARDNTLLGSLDFFTLQESVRKMKTDSSRDPLENLLSLSSLYWISLAQLLDSIFSITRPGKGGQQ